MHIYIYIYNLYTHIRHTCICILQSIYNHGCILCIHIIIYAVPGSEGSLSIQGPRSSFPLSSISACTGLPCDTLRKDAIGRIKLADGTPQSWDHQAPHRAHRFHKIPDLHRLTERLFRWQGIVESICELRWSFFFAVRAEKTQNTFYSNRFAKKTDHWLRLRRCIHVAHCRWNLLCANQLRQCEIVMEMSQSVSYLNNSKYSKIQWKVRTHFWQNQSARERRIQTFKHSQSKDTYFSSGYSPNLQ